MSRLKFGDLASIRRRDEAIDGDAGLRMRASFGPGPVGTTCAQCRELQIGTGDLGRLFHYCRLYRSMMSQLHWKRDWPTCGKYKECDGA